MKKISTTSEKEGVARRPIFHTPTTFFPSTKKEKKRALKLF
jgi:hypothetical protein